MVIWEHDLGGGSKVACTEQLQIIAFCVKLVQRCWRGSVVLAFTQ